MTPARSPTAPADNLPRRPTRFVGREAEIVGLSELLGASRLLTIVGPGGSGKTRLAEELARVDAERWSNGVWWVELGGLEEPEGVAQAVTEAVGLLVDPARGPLASLGAQLAGRRMLVCLDNCEHLLAEAAAVAEALGRDCPEVSVLATSREPLGLAAETIWRLAPMPSADARALFVERAIGVEPQLDRERLAEDEIESMCSRLDGSPLAIELAAAWLPTLTPREIDAGLDDRFALLVRSPRDAVPRQSSLLASMAWSHDLLNGEDQVVFRRLGVFPGGFDLAAAQAVCSGDGVAPVAVLPSLARLIDKSLVTARERDGAISYRLLETIRQYAMDRLRAAGERPPTADRHLRHLLERVEELSPLREEDKDAWRTALAPAHEGFRAAILHGLEGEDPDPARRLAAELPWFWHLSRRGRDGLDLLRRAIAAAPEEDSALQARLLAGVALVADTADPLDVEVDAADRAAWMAREHGEEGLLALCLELGAVGRLYTDLDAAREESLAAEEIARRADERFVLDAGCALRGIVLHLRDEHTEARELLGEAAERLLVRGDRGVASTAQAYLSGSALLTGDLPAAVDWAERAIATAEPLADHLRIGMGRAALALARGAGGEVELGLEALEPLRPLLDPEDGAFLPEVQRALGLLHLSAGEAETALDLLTAEAGATDSGRPTYLALRALPALASAQRQTGQTEKALRTATDAVALARERAMPGVLADALAELGTPGAEVDREEALRHAHEALAIRAERGLRPGIIASLEALACLGTGSSSEQDARLLGAATAGRERLRLPAPIPGRAEVEARVGSLREELGDRFEAAWAAGTELPLADAAAYAGRARGSRDRPAGGWGSLTPTELEVVRLATEGLSNPEIGSRLFMSRSTVKTHLSHVYAKLNIGNRTELAAIAAKHPGDG